MAALLIGTYPPDGPGEPYAGEGIYRIGIDVSGRRLGSPELVMKQPAPSWLVRHPELPVVYAISELMEGGELYTYSLGEGGDLAPLPGAQQALALTGPWACHGTVVGAGPGPGLLVVANYGSGTLDVFRLAPDGAPQPDPVHFPHVGSGPVADRQDGPHAHSAWQVGGWVLSCDLGTDQLRRFRLVAGPDGVVTSLVELDPPIALTPGTGPRHIAVHPSGRFLYVADELSAEVTVLSFDPETCAVKELERLAASESGRSAYDAPEGPYDMRETCAPSHIAMSGDGALVYVANRGPGTVTTMLLEDGGARLEVADETDAGCQTPRHFAVIPAADGGEWLMIAGQNSGRVTVVRRPPGSVDLTLTRASAALPQPVCILPIP